MQLPSISYGPGFIENANSVRVICHVGEGEDAIPAVAHWDGLKKKWSLLPMKWVPVGLAMLDLPQPCVFALSVDGTVGYGYGDYKEERMDATEDGPKSRGPLREIRVIDAQLYATGMGRQVYRKELNGNWHRIDAGVVAPKGEIAPSGFSSIHGTAVNDIWAVGILGEIWHFNSSVWTKQESPTNLIIHKVIAVQPDNVYAVAQKGQVLLYDGKAWNLVYSDPRIDNLWDAEWFLDTLYVASEKAIYRLLSDNSLEVISTTAANSFGHLHAKDGVLWSFGTSHLAYTHDGNIWHTAPPFFG
jgi:hypothetical protein